MKKLHQYLVPVREVFEEAANPDNARWAAAYMRNQFLFFGIKTPERRKIFREFIRTDLPGPQDIAKIVESAWQQPEREFQYFAIEFAALYSKDWDKQIISLFEKMILEKSWWDTVDAISNLLNAPYFLRFPEQIIPVCDRWNRSENIWLQRSSLLFQLPYKKKTDKALLGKYILQLSKSEEFFVQKAIGWALRQYARTDPEWVKEFVRKNKLATLSRKEALKHFEG